jgi:hypothetical protein
VEFRITIEGLQDVVGKLSQDWKGIFSDGMLNAAKQTIEPAVREYPPENHLPMAPFWTPKQRAWFFATGINGNFPYSRTMFESGRWTTEGGSLKVTVQNDAWYGIYDQDPDGMSMYHAQQGWIDFAYTANKVFPEFLEILMQIIQSKL